MKGRLIAIVFAIVILGLAWQERGLLGHRASDADARLKPAPALLVETTKVTQKSVPLLVHAVGLVESEHSVAVRPQVSGILQSVDFTEGSDVKVGQLLFRIDQAPFNVAVAQARAALARDRASLANARWQSRRLAPLAKLDYVTPQEYENAQTTEKQALAAIASDKAQLQQARIQLGYTDIRAPISGRVGAVSVKSGNLVESTAATPLVTINQIAPILVRFALPQSRLDQVRRYMSQGPVRVRLSDAQADSARGDLVFVDNAVDTSTGTVTLKAEFPNKSANMWPGQYVSVDVVLTVRKNALVVPEMAVQPGQNGSFVYLVRNHVVHVKPVTVASQRNGETVIATGVNAGDTVVVHVPRNLRDGLPVREHPADMDETKNADTTVLSPSQ